VPASGIPRIQAASAGAIFIITHSAQSPIDIPSDRAFTLANSSGTAPACGGGEDSHLKGSKASFSRGEVGVQTARRARILWRVAPDTESWLVAELGRLEWSRSLKRCRGVQLQESARFNSTLAIHRKDQRTKGAWRGMLGISEAQRVNADPRAARAVPCRVNDDNDDLVIWLFTPRPADIGTLPIKRDRSLIRATARAESSRPIYSSNSKSPELCLSPLSLNGCVRKFRASK